MQAQWRGRIAVLAIGLAIIAILGMAGATGLGRSGPALLISRPDGALLARVPLPPDGSFSLRYRNSLYGSLAEERFVIGDAGRLDLVELQADELAVLEEYYAIDEAAVPSDGRSWAAPPAHRPTIHRLRVAATDLGERTLLVAGREPLELWRLVDDAEPSVILELDG
ncbi:MAG: hypothetical protein ACR2K4_05435 [Candidatus Limnocylindria bacterium]